MKPSLWADSRTGPLRGPSKEESGKEVPSSGKSQSQARDGTPSWGALQGECGGEEKVAVFLIQDLRFSDSFLIMSLLSSCHYN